MALSKYYYSMTRFRVGDVPFLWHGQEPRGRSAQFAEGDVAALRHLLYEKIELGELRVDASDNPAATWKGISSRHDDSYVARDDLLSLAKDLGESPPFLFDVAPDSSDKTADGTVFPALSPEGITYTSDQWARMTVTQKVEAMLAGAKVPPPQVNPEQDEPDPVSAVESPEDTPGGLKQASVSKIHDTIKRLYDVAESRQERIPNINETGKQVQVSLRAEGLYASQPMIKKLAEENQHASRRGAVGKHVS